MSQLAKQIAAAYVDWKISKQNPPLSEFTERSLRRNMPMIIEEILTFMQKDYCILSKEELAVDYKRLKSSMCNGYAVDTEKLSKIAWLKELIGEDVLNKKVTSEPKFQIGDLVLYKGRVKQVISERMPNGYYRIALPNGQSPICKIEDDLDYYDEKGSKRFSRWEIVTVRRWDGFERTGVVVQVEKNHYMIAFGQDIQRIQKENVFPLKN